MKHALFSRIGIGLAYIGTTICMVAMALAAPLLNLIAEAFPPEAPALNLTADAPSTEVTERMSQTGKGVWAFVTDLFSVEGRQYCWQAGTIT